MTMIPGKHLPHFAAPASLRGKHAAGEISPIRAPPNMVWLSIVNVGARRAGGSVRENGVLWNEGVCAGTRNRSRRGFSVPAPGADLPQIRRHVCRHRLLGFGGRRDARGLVFV